MSLSLTNPIKQTAKSVRSAYWNVLAPTRLLPSFIIIGVQKGGTTSLYNYLIEHPNIATAKEKELHFFDFDGNYNKGMSWYRTNFPAINHKQNVITGEATVDYLFNPYTPQRVARALPNVKLIVLLRNPVDRAYSHYRHAVRRGREKLSMEEAFTQEEQMTQEERDIIARDGNNYNSYSDKHFLYLSRGLYAEQLERWFTFFPKDQVIVFKSEELYSDTAKIYQQTLDFLDVPGDVEANKEFEVHNKKDTPSGMDSQLRKHLIEYYAPHNARLYELLGRDFGWNA